MWPLILEHVRLLFQCGESLEEICDVFHVVLKVDKMKVSSLNNMIVGNVMYST